MATNKGACTAEPSHYKSEIPSKVISQSSGTKWTPIQNIFERILIRKTDGYKNRLPYLTITSLKYPQREFPSHLERNGHRFKIDFWLLYCYDFFVFFEVVLGIQCLSEFTIESVWTIFLWEHSYFFLLTCVFTRYIILQLNY